MLFNPQHEDPLVRLTSKVRLAQSVTPDLLACVVTDACFRVVTLSKAGKAARLDQLIKTGAWTDAALALIELESPQWTLRRLVHEDGEWVCSLSRQPNLPAALDDTADACHEVLPLAILGAFLEARRRVTSTSVSPAMHELRSNCEAICCDNFA